MIKIAVDAMGGDKAPKDIIKGSVIGSKQSGAGIILTGDKRIIENELKKYDCTGCSIEIEHTDEYLIEGEPAAYTLRYKRKASVIMAAKLVKDGRAEAAVSMGPTGGVVTAALMVLGTMEGISRPVFGGTFLGLASNMILMDMGGNLDCKPDQLLDFAIIGNIYARKLLNIENPTIALLNVGVEEGKGNELVKESYILLKNSGLNFIGNIEGNDIAAGKANVIVCDGYTGNAIAKFCEGLGRSISDWIGSNLEKELGSDRLKEIQKDLLNLTVRADNTGGGPVWGVDGLILKGHGRSGYEEVSKTIYNAKEYVEMNIVEDLKSELKNIREHVK
jgi:phosphate acyltransferase